MMFVHLLAGVVQVVLADVDLMTAKLASNLGVRHLSMHKPRSKKLGYYPREPTATRAKKMTNKCMVIQSKPVATLLFGS